MDAKQWEERKQELIRVERKNWEEREIKHSIDEKQWEERELKRMQETASERKVEILAEIQKRKENEEQARAAREDRIKQQPEPSPVAFVPLEDWRDQ